MSDGDGLKMTAMHLPTTPSGLAGSGPMPGFLSTETQPREVAMTGRLNECLEDLRQHPGFPELLSATDAAVAALQDLYVGGGQRLADIPAQNRSRSRSAPAT